MKFNRPAFDPDVTHIVRGGEMLFAGQQLQNGDVFPMDADQSPERRRSAQLYRMGRIVQPEEIGAAPVPAAASARAPRAKRKRTRKPAKAPALATVAG